MPPAQSNLPSEVFRSGFASVGRRYLSAAEFVGRAAQEPSPYGAACLSLAAAAAAMLTFRALGPRPASAAEGALYSWALASVASLPLLVWAWRVLAQAWTRALVLLWFPLKMLLSLAALPDSAALAIGDSTALHAIGTAFANYWAAGGDWLFPEYVFRTYPVKYLGAPYLFGLPYLAFGHHPVVVLPWLTLLHLMAGTLAFALMRRVRLSPSLSSLALVYVLYCPAWLLLTNALFRDIALFNGLILVGVGLAGLAEGWSTRAAVLLGAGALVLYLFREQYLAALCLVPLLLGCTKRVRVSGAVGGALVLLAALSAGQFLDSRPHVKPYLERTVELARMSSAVGEAAPRSRSFIDRYANWRGPLLPLAVPLRVIAGVVAPFPWTSTRVTLKDQCGGLWLYAVFHMLQAVLHLGILAWLALVLCDRRFRGPVMWGRRGALVVYGGCLLAAGALSWVGFYRNVLPAFVFFWPAMVVLDGRRGFTQLLALGVLVASALHVAYYFAR